MFPGKREHNVPASDSCGHHHGEPPPPQQPKHQRPLGPSKLHQYLTLQTTNQAVALNQMNASIPHLMPYTVSTVK